jgi:hypothetical protein
MRVPCRISIAAVFLLTVQAPLAAQDTVQVGVRAELPPGEELPKDVADRLVAFYNSPGTFRFSGRTLIPRERTVTGDVAILGGPVELAGTIDGDVVILNGDITLREDSRIIGSLTVVGGVIIGQDRGRVDSVMLTYAAVFRYRRTPDGIEYIGSERETTGPPSGTTTLALPSWEMGESEIFVSAGAYNVVEGLPLTFGPRITTGGRNPLRAEAFLVWRTEGGFDPERKHIGWEVRLRQWVGGHHAVYLEGTYWSVNDAIENWKLTNLENSLSLFLFRRDYRSYYARKGWYGRVGWDASRFSGHVEYRDEDNDSLTAGSPVTVFFNTSDPYPVNAFANPGRLRSVVASLGYDTRNDRQTPYSGWYGRVTLERSVGSELVGIDGDFSRFFLDLRRYLRVSRSSSLGLRLVGGGRIGSTELPAQRQHVIGGTGSLPGYSMEGFDCGVRESGAIGQVPAYGCQRFTLFQAQYRSGLDFRFRWDYDQSPEDFTGDIFSAQFNPSIVLFYDVGAAWSVDEGFFEHLGKSDNWVADVGGGVDFGGFGFYLAYPLVGTGGFNFVVRLTGRF